MDAVILGAADWHQDDIVLMAFLNHHLARRGLDIAARLSDLTVGRDAVIIQNGLDLLLRGVPQPFLQPSYLVILKKYVRIRCR